MTTEAILENRSSDFWNEQNRSAEKRLDAFSCSYSGRLCGPTHEAPTPHDIAVALGRICRFAGNGIAFYPVLLHSMAVADLLPKSLKLYGLLHDATEANMGDVPSPFKFKDYKVVEAAYHRKIHDSFGLPELSKAHEEELKWADAAMIAAEVWVGIGPAALKFHFPDRFPAAEKIASKYLKKYPPKQCIQPGGRAVSAFLRRLDEERETA